MVSGIRDAKNLAWKLDLALRGTIRWSTLDSYQAERMMHTRHLITACVEVGRISCTIGEEDAQRRDERWIQRCSVCHSPIFFPRVLCPFCGSTALEVERASGSGTIYSITLTAVRDGSPRPIDSCPLSQAAARRTLAHVYDGVHRTMRHPFGFFALEDPAA
jgi:hypothetical protein